MTGFLKASKRVRGVALADRIELSMAGEDLKFWSPQLVIDVEADGQGGAHLRARFGPDPYVWALYMLSYLALTLLTLLSLAYGFSQLVLGRPPTGLYVAPVGAVLAGLVYGASYVGQGLGSEQMYLLRATLTDTVEATEHDLAVARGEEG